MIIKPGKATHHLLNILNEWRQTYYSNHAGDIVFQNQRLFSNVWFTDKSFHTIMKHSAGFENIPEVIMNPDEVWSTWEDETEQQVTLRVYMKFGEVSYLVQTRDGVVMDAFAVTNNAANGFRKGCLL